MDKQIIVTNSCRSGNCADCSGGVYRPAKIAGRTVYNWFHECACGCHATADTRESDQFCRPMLNI